VTATAIYFRPEFTQASTTFTAAAVAAGHNRAAAVFLN
jgi:hypothetical protein